MVGVLRGGDAMIPKRLKMSFHSSYWQALRPTPPLTPPLPVIIICCVPPGTSQNAREQQVRTQITKAANLVSITVMRRRDLVWS